MADSHSADPSSSYVTEERGSTTAEPVTSKAEAGPELVLVTDGYYKYADIVWEWCKALPRWHVSHVVLTTSIAILLADSFWSPFIDGSSE